MGLFNFSELKIMYLTNKDSISQEDKLYMMQHIVAELSKLRKDSHEYQSLSNLYQDIEDTLGINS